MSNPFSQVNEADLAGQAQSADADADESVSPVTPTGEANIADVIEQHRDVPIDDEAYER